MVVSCALYAHGRPCVLSVRLLRKELSGSFRGSSGLLHFCDLTTAVRLSIAVVSNVDPVQDGCARVWVLADDCVEPGDGTDPDVLVEFLDVSVPGCGLARGSEGRMGGLEDNDGWSHDWIGDG